MVPGEGDDSLRRARHVVKIEPELASLHQRGQGGAVFGTDHDLDTKPRRRFHEVVGAVGAARDQQEDARHQC